MTIQKVGNSINYIDIYIFTMTVLFIKCSVLYVTLICWPAQLESSLTTIPVPSKTRFAQLKSRGNKKCLNFSH